MRRWDAKRRRIAAFGSRAERASDGPPIFVIGCHRSGTTLTRVLLNSHSRIACPGETQFLTGLCSPLREPEVAWGLEQLGVTREEIVSNIRTLALHYYERYLHVSGKARWADKTPQYTALAGHILEVFGDVRFIYCLRHGMDVCHSIRDLPWFQTEESRHMNPVQRLQRGATHWQFMTRSFDEFQRQHPEVCHVVRFEELTDEPEKTARAMFEFLGEKWEPEVLDYRAFVHGGSSDPKTISGHTTIKPNSGNYRSWPEETQAVIYEQLAEDLERQGYALQRP